MNLWPFFTFYGGKWRAAPRYPAPSHEHIIEPFAGAAGYSVRHYQKSVTLVEQDPVIAGLWRFLIGSSAASIRALPLIAMDQSVHDLNVCQEAKSLIGFWLNKATASPCIRPGAWMREGLRPKSFWGPEIRERIASQVERIAHWKVCEGDYRNAPGIEATWFIDPPYQGAGKLYRYNSSGINYATLADWCRSRRGQVMVCENDGADWLPFSPFLKIKSSESSRSKSVSCESIWMPGARE